MINDDQRGLPVIFWNKVDKGHYHYKVSFSINYGHCHVSTGYIISFTNVEKYEKVRCGKTNEQKQVWHVGNNSIVGEEIMTNGKICRDYRESLRLSGDNKTNDLTIKSSLLEELFQPIELQLLALYERVKPV